MKLRTRLLSGLALLVLAAVASSGWLILTVAQRELTVAQEVDARSTGERLLHLLAASAAGSAGALDEPAAQERIRHLTGEWIARGLVREVTVSKDGRVIVGAASANDALGLVTPRPLVRREGDAIWVYGAVAGPRGDRAAVRLSLPGEDLIARAIERAGLLAVLAALLCAAAVSAFGAFFVERIARTIGELAEAARRVASGDLEGKPVPAAPGGDELQRLAADFNEMTAALRRERATVLAQRGTLVQQEKLATVGRLAAGVAHEIGNPLAAIIGFADMLRSDEKEKQPSRKLSEPDRSDALGRIHGEGVRIQSIIRELLDYSRPPQANPEPMALADAIANAISLLRPQPRFRQVEVQLDVAPSLPRVLGEQARVEQILVNLLLNAADAMAGVGRMRIAALETERGVALTVEDSGPGVVEADRDKIFDPFFSTKDAGKGTGLGLSVSQAIASAMGAELSLDAAFAGGARFVLLFPNARVVR